MAHGLRMKITAGFGSRGKRATPTGAPTEIPGTGHSRITGGIGNHRPRTAGLHTITAAGATIRTIVGAGSLTTCGDPPGWIGASRTRILAGRRCPLARVSTPRLGSVFTAIELASIFTPAWKSA